MRWVHERSLAFSVAVFLPVLLGLGIPLFNFSGKDLNTHSNPADIPHKIQCFEPEMLIRLESTNPLCPVDFIFLGDTPLSESATADGSVVEIHPLLMARFTVARNFARADGVLLTLSSGFRTLQRQQELFDREIEIRGSETEAAKWVLPPRSSHHPRGLAIDVNYPGDKPGALWLENNGSKFGICRVYGNEWWHFEGVIAPGELCPALAPDALVDLEGR